MERYHNWLVLELYEKEKYCERFALCKCLCGNIKRVNYRMLKTGKTKSCGCFKRGVGKPIVTNDMIVSKYLELKSLKDTARFFKKGDSVVSKILKVEGIELYASLRKDKEEVRRKRVVKVMNYKKRRMKRDPLYKSIIRIRGLIGQVFIKQNFTKKSKCSDILGIDWKGFKTHIENKFQKNMSWDNYGLWEYDHIVPISSAKTYDEIIKLNHYTNFQPLWKEENRVKGCKV
jgi:hypothetical protein